jgi:hypothetical protein
LHWPCSASEDRLVCLLGLSQAVERARAAARSRDTAAASSGGGRTSA